MAGLSLDHPWSFAFGLLGNIMSLLVYLAPVPTFRRIHRTKSTEGFQSVPYVAALFSSMLWIYYALAKSEDVYLLITINAFGCLIETVYIVMFLIYAPRAGKISTAKLLLLLNVGAFGAILICTLLLSRGSKRAVIIGWICVAFSVSVFAAPLSIMRFVIRTRSVEFMPFTLSFFLTASAVSWFAYGISIKDYYVAAPNVLGFTFGMGQMVLYLFYKRASAAIKAMELEKPVAEVVINVANLAGAGPAVHPIEEETYEVNSTDKEDRAGKEKQQQQVVVVMMVISGDQKGVGGH